MTRLVILALGSLAAQAIATDPPPTPLTLDGLAGAEAHEAREKVSLTLDRALDEHWHLLLGAGGDRLAFADIAAGLPMTLQSATATLGAEYRVEDDTVLALSLQPGWYGDARLASGAFDMPVALMLAYPLGKQWALVGGLESSRLADYFLPLVGVSATFDAHWKMDLIFPAATLSYQPDKQTTASLFMEWQDDGYQLSDGRRVAYRQSHAGASWEQELRGGWTTTLKAGWAFDRVLDFYKLGEHQHLGHAPFVALGVSRKW